MAVSWYSFMILAAMLGLGNPEEDPIESGILLRHMGEVIVTGDSWTAMASINIEAIVTSLQLLVLVLLQVKTIASSLGTTSVKDAIASEISVHENRIRNVASKAVLLHNMLPTKGRRRRKRSSGLVEMLNWSQHFPTSVPNNNNNLTVLTTLEDRIKRNMGAIANITMKRTSDTNMISSSLRALGTVIEDLDSFIKDTLEAMVALTNGRLSPNLVTPSELVSILRTAKDQFSGSVRPLTELREDDVYAYYTYASVHAIANTTSITVYIKLPFKADGRVFDLYEPHPFPAYHPTARVYLEVSRPSELMLVSKLKDKAAEIHSGRILEDCRRRRDTFLCPADITLDDTGFSCTLALILGQEDRAAKLCERKVVQSDFEPRWVRAPNGWYYSVSEPTKILRISEHEKIPVVRYLEGTGFLKDEAGTYTKTEKGAVLFPADMLGEHFQGDKGEVVIPPLVIANLLKQREVDAILRRKEDTEERDGATVSVLALLATLERQHDIDRGVFYAALIGAYVFLIILAFGKHLKEFVLAKLTKKEENNHSLPSSNVKDACVTDTEAESSKLIVSINTSQNQNETAGTEKEKVEKRRRRRVVAKPPDQTEPVCMPALPPKPDPNSSKNLRQPNEHISFFNHKKKSSNSAQQLL